MNPLKISAFSRGDIGGNPAGVWIDDAMPAESAMQNVARELGYSETVFAAPQGDTWRVRYYSPEGEVAFCGHATIALGAAMGERFGAGTFALDLSAGNITVTAEQTADGWAASLQSPPTKSQPLPDTLSELLMKHFGLHADDLDPRLPPTLANAGNQHAVFALRSRRKLAEMSYDFEEVRDLMIAEDLTTISLIFIAGRTSFIARNAFAIGGIVEDAATGAAAAALGGALVDLQWPNIGDGGEFTIFQGDDMDQPSTLNVAVTGKRGDSVRVSGATRKI